MAFENLFIRTRRSLGGIELDAVLSETHNNEIRLTKNPVELGADITDHAIIEPKRVNVVAQVSDTPLGAAAFGQIVDLITGLFGTSTTQNITRSNATYNALVQITEAREPIELQTKLKLYEYMIITSLTTTQDKDSSRIVLLNIALEEVLITQSQVVTLPSSQLPAGSVREQAQSAEEKGRQEVLGPAQSESTSVLNTVRGWLF